MKKTMDLPKLITVTGIVTPWEWDGNDNVVAVVISAGDESEYIVEAKLAIRQLTHHFYDRIVATGRVIENRFGDEVFVMEDFETITENDDLDEDEEWDKANEDLLKWITAEPGL